MVKHFFLPKSIIFFFFFNKMLIFWLQRFSCILFCRYGCSILIDYTFQYGKNVHSVRGRKQFVKERTNMIIGGVHSRINYNLKWAFVVTRDERELAPFTRLLVHPSLNLYNTLWMSLSLQILNDNGADEFSTISLDNSN